MTTPMREKNPVKILGGLKAAATRDRKAELRRPRGGTPVYDHVHAFRPWGDAFMPTQCALCWGWRDDPRHR